MNITDGKAGAPWLLFVFSLPSGKASERVQLWRKLQKFGAISFRNSGYLLPNNPENQERCAWAASMIRSHDGEASSLEVAAIRDVSNGAVQEMFRDARQQDFIALLGEIAEISESPEPGSAQIARLRRRLEEMVAIDFFESPLRRKAEAALMRLETPVQQKRVAKRRKAVKKDYQARTWITRSRPGIDRVSSAWLISRFIDAKPKFIFANDATKHPKAVPFDMYIDGGFGHDGEDCTFETLCHAFGIRDKRVMLVAQSIHDADLEDGKFGRTEGQVINLILRGWERQNVSDDELLRRGMELVEGLYQAIQ
jgi:hypothetical protein